MDTPEHAEEIEITYDQSNISNSELLDVFWRNISATQVNGQFVDIGPQNWTAIVYHNQQQRKLAEISKENPETY